MADTKMSALPPAAALAGADIFAVDQGGVSVAATATQIATFVGSGISSPPFVDTTAIVKGSVDATKQLRFEVDTITAGTTRIASIPNQNFTIAGIDVAQTFGVSQTFASPNDTIPVVIQGASITGAGTTAFLDIAGTWNTTGAPDAIRLTITDTASNAASNLLDLMVGVSSLFAVRKDGRATLAGDILVSGAASPAITSIKVNVGIAAAQNVIRINGNSTANNAPVLDFLRSGNREWTFAPISNSFFITNSGGVANFNDATLNATPNWEFTSLGAFKVNGGTAGTGLLHVNTDTSGAGLTIFEQASADTDDYDLSFRKARGTVAVPTVITVGDGLGNIMFRGYSGAGGYVTGASIRAVSTGTIATTRVASSLIFSTGTDAAPTVLTDRWLINNAGHLLSAASNSFDIGAAATTADRPRNIYVYSDVYGRGFQCYSGSGSTTQTSFVSSAVNGDLLISNNSISSFTKLQFGTATTSSPAIGRDAVNGFTLQSGNGTTTWNDASTAASGTVADRYLWGIAVPTLTSTNATVTYTRASCFLITGAPVAGTNVSIGTAYSLYVAGGLSRFDASVLAHGGTAIPAGGTAGAGLLVSSTSNFGIFFGSGAPSLSAAKGSLYLRSDGSTTNDRAYINTNGGTTWTALTTVA